QHVYLWWITPQSTLSGVDLGSAGQWSLVATGDYDHNGVTDVLWQNAVTGQVVPGSYATGQPLNLPTAAAVGSQASGMQSGAAITPTSTSAGAPSIALLAQQMTSIFPSSGLVDSGATTLAPRSLSAEAQPTLAQPRHA